MIRNSENNEILIKKLILQVKVKLFFAVILIMILISSNVYSYDKSRTRVGIHLGAQYNMIGIGFGKFYGVGATKESSMLDADDGYLSFVKKNSIDGTSITPSFGIFAEYESNSWWGLMLRAYYNNLSGEVSDITYEPNTKFDMSMNYFTFSPSLKIKPESFGDFFTYIGPSFSLNSKGEYDLLTNGQLNNGGSSFAGAYKVPRLNSFVFGLTLGIGLDWKTKMMIANRPFYMSPYFETSYFVNQKSSSNIGASQNTLTDNWATFVVKFGIDAKIGIDEKKEDIIVVKPMQEVDFTTPDQGIRRIKVNEYFPTLPYIFFDKNSASIPERYVQLSKNKANDFKESSLQDMMDGSLSQDEQKKKLQNVYYNILNIVGDRLRNTKNISLKLIGSAPNEKDGEQMAINIKNYLVENFNVEANRISIEGRDLPRIPSGNSSTTSEFKPLVDEENRRVEFVPSSVEFLKPVLVNRQEEMPFDNDFTLNTLDNIKVITWQLLISGEGKNFNFGPYSDTEIRIPASKVLGNRSSGQYNAELVVRTEDGRTLTHTKNFVLNREDDIIDKAIVKYQMLFNYAQTDAIRNSETFLRNELSPKLFSSENIMVTGYTDNIGRNENNLKLSKDRAREAKSIIADELRKQSLKVPVSYVGYGNDPSKTIFENKFPEGRFYNRVVSIEAIPAK